MAKKNLPIESCWLYAVQSPRDLARRLQAAIEFRDISGFAARLDNHKLFEVKAANGKSRDVEEPKKQLQRIQRRVHVLLSRVDTPSYLHSTVKESCYIANALKHPVGLETIKVDIKKFFQSTKKAAVFQFFAEKLKCRRDVAGILADLLTFRDHLPTGGASSPILSFFVYQSMFDEIHTLAVENNIVMTLYVDDMAFSGKTFPNDFIPKVREIICSHELRSHKIKRFASQEAKVVTGACMTIDGPKVPRKLQRKIADSFKQVDALVNAANRRVAADRLLGRLGAAGKIEPVFLVKAKNFRTNFTALEAEKGNEENCRQP